MQTLPKWPYPFCEHCVLNTVLTHRTHKNTQSKHAAIGKLSVLRPKEHLFRRKDSFHMFFAICSGSIKSYTTDVEGQEKVLGFHFPGEILGFDAIHSSVYPHNAIALETTHVCAVSFEQFLVLLNQIPTLQKQFIQLLSREIAGKAFYLGNYSAEARLSGFLLQLPSRHSTKSHLHLSMGRQDIANHLGMAIETVSRILTHLQKTGLIQATRRHIEIKDRERLKHLARCMLEQNA